MSILLARHTLGILGKGLHTTNELASAMCNEVHDKSRIKDFILVLETWRPTEPEVCKMNDSYYYTPKSRKEKLAEYAAKYEQPDFDMEI